MYKMKTSSVLIITFFLIALLIPAFNSNAASTPNEFPVEGLNRIQKIKYKIFKKAIDKQLKKLRATNVDCDKVYLDSGDILSVHVVEVGDYSVKYRFCGDKEGKVIEISKNKVNKIQYVSGDVMTFSGNTPADFDSKSYSDAPSISEDLRNTRKSTGIALGFLLGLIGVLIAYGISANYGFKDRSMTTGAWIGVGLAVLFTLILTVIFSISIL